MNQIEAPILKILSQYTTEDLNTLSATESFEDIGIDSLSLVEIIFEIEEHFDISIPNESNIAEKGFSLNCLDDVYQLVKALVEEKEK